MTPSTPYSSGEGCTCTYCDLGAFELCRGYRIVSPGLPVGEGQGSFSQGAKIPTEQADWPVLDPTAPELVQVAQCLAMCIREVPGWADNASLITAHCHATVLVQDLAAQQEQANDRR